MKTSTLILAVSLVAINSCKQESKPAVKPQPKIVKSKSLIIGNPLDCGIQNTLIFPVGSNYKPDVIEGPHNGTIVVTDVVLCFSSNASSTLYDKNATSEYINEHADQFDIRNILFYDQLTGKTFSLLQDTMHILSFALHKEFSNPLILYRIVKDDINNDTLFNDKDPVMLYVSDINGKNMTEITPENEQFVDYFYYPSSQTILTKTIIDANKDSVFTSMDETNFREMKIKTPALGREIFSKSLKDSLRTQ